MIHMSTPDQRSTIFVRAWIHGRMLNPLQFDWRGW